MYQCSECLTTSGELRTGRDVVKVLDGIEAVKHLTKIDAAGAEITRLLYAAGAIPIDQDSSVFIHRLAMIIGIIDTTIGDGDIDTEKLHAEFAQSFVCSEDNAAE